LKKPNESAPGWQKTPIHLELTQGDLMTNSSLFLYIILGLVILILFISLIVLVYLYINTRNQIAGRAQELYDRWREVDVAYIREEQNRLATADAKLRFEQWLQEKEKQIREDAILKSQAVTMGKVTEHFIPYLPEFNYNPQDARFIGSPIDFIVFDGLSEGDLRQITFVEVKSGSSSLTRRERWVRNVIQEGKITWELVKTKGQGTEVLED
jgi:predicted Holliday junction resolvase-like endonuclease